MKITRKVINFNKVNQTGGAFKLNEHGKERFKKYNDPEYKEKKGKIYKPEFPRMISFVTADGVRGDVHEIMWDDAYKALDLFYYRVHLDNDRTPKILSEKQMFHEYELDKIQTGGSGFVAFDIDAMKAKAAKKREDRLRAYNMMQQQNPGMAGFAPVSQPQLGFASVKQQTPVGVASVSQPKVGVAYGSKPQAGVAKKKWSFSAPGYPTLTPLKEYLGPKSLKQLNKGDIILRKDRHYYKVIDPNVQGPTFTTTETEIKKIKNLTMYGVGDDVIYTPCNTQLFKNPRGGSEVLANLIKGKEYYGKIIEAISTPNGDIYTVKLIDTPRPTWGEDGFILEATLDCLKPNPNYSNPERRKFYLLAKVKVGVTAPQIALAKFTSVSGTPTLETEFNHIFIFDDDNYLVDSNHSSMRNIKNYQVNFTPEQIKQKAKKLVDDSHAAYERMKKEMYEKIARESEYLKKIHSEEIKKLNQKLNHLISIKF